MATARAGPPGLRAAGLVPAARPLMMTAARSIRQQRQQRREERALVVVVAAAGRLPSSPPSGDAGGNDAGDQGRATRTATKPASARHATRQARQPLAALPPPVPTTTTADDPGANPLELLRKTRDPPRRAALMQRATAAAPEPGAAVGGWRAWSERYRPLAVERLLCEELGVGRDDAMLLAVGNPALAEAFPEVLSSAAAAAAAAADSGPQGEALQQDCPSLAPARRALRALRGAGLSDADAWFAVSRRPALLAHPPALQRWLDLLSLYEARPADVVSFLTKVPEALLREPSAEDDEDDEEEEEEQDAADDGEDSAAEAGGRRRQQRPRSSSSSPQQQEQHHQHHHHQPTFAEAQAVARYLTNELRVPRAQLAARVLAARPALLARDVALALRPLQAFAERELGLSSECWGRVALACPELLAEASVERHLRPYLEFCREELGASAAQAGELLLLAPRLPLGRPRAAQAPADSPATVISHADSDTSLDACPAEAALAPRLRALEELAGVRRGSERLRQLVAAAAATAAASGGRGGGVDAGGGGSSSGLEWLAAAQPDAPAAQLRALQSGLGASREDLGCLAVACPALLSQRPDELQRRAGWLGLAAAAGGGGGGGAGDCSGDSGGALRLALAHPHVLAVPLRQLAAPRLAFARAVERADAAALSPAAARAAGLEAARAALEAEAEGEEQGAAGGADAPPPAAAAAPSPPPSPLPLPDLTALVAPGADDAAWIAGLLRMALAAAAPAAPAAPSVAAAATAAGLPPSSSSSPSLACPSRLAAAYVSFRAEFDRGYADAVAEASTAELRKLGIMEGSGGAAGAAAR